MANEDVEIRDLGPRDIIFKQGDSGAEAFIVEDGLVEISVDSDKGSTLVLSTIKRGEMFGEMALISSAPRMATATAMKKTRIIVIPKTAFEKLLSRTDVVMRTVMNTLIARLRGQTDRNLKNTL